MATDSIDVGEGRTMWRYRDRGVVVVWVTTDRHLLEGRTVVANGRTRVELVDVETHEVRAWQAVIDHLGGWSAAATERVVTDEPWPEPVTCESCGEPVGVVVLERHPDDGPARLCQRCAAAWEEEPF